MKEEGIEKSREEVLKNSSDRAVENFKQGYNCSQSVFLAFADRYGIDDETALKISASFGGGMGRMREVCGCMSAMALIAGLETGSAKPRDPEGKKANYETVQHLAGEFKKCTGGSIVCRELLGLSADAKGEMSSPTPSERTEQYYKKRPCIRLIQDACSIIEKEFFGGRENEQSADDGTDNR